MNQAVLEHINVTVADAGATAEKLCSLFDWHVRWEGDAIYGGRSVHVGTDFSYLALYQPPLSPMQVKSTYEANLGLNHVAVVVNDLEETERRVLDAGYKTHSHANYEPGQRFYFHDEQGLEIEVVMYD